MIFSIQILSHFRTIQSTGHENTTPDHAVEQHVYVTPGVDYTLQGRRDHTPVAVTAPVGGNPGQSVYNTHGMISHIQQGQQQQNNVQRPPSAQNTVPYNYESTHSPLG